MSVMDGLKNGAKIIGVILLAVIGAYALAIMGLILIGILANVVNSGDVTVPVATNTTVTTQLSTFNTLVGTVLNPFSTIAALVIVAVLLAIFFKNGKLGGGGSNMGVN